MIAADGTQLGIVDLEDALAEAKKSSMDLVGMSMEADPPVCRIMDYGKHIYQKSKKTSGKKHKRVQVKEIKFRPTTEENDYQVKLRKIKQFLEKGDKVKVGIHFRGREMMHKNLGIALLHRVEADLEGVGVLEQQGKMEGRQMSMIIAPDKKGVNAVEKGKEE